MKEPDEPMYTLTIVERHGVEYSGRVRRLMSIECFRLQGYTDEQFYKLIEIGIPESQLYKMAGTGKVHFPQFHDGRLCGGIHRRRFGSTVLFPAVL